MPNAPQDCYRKHPTVAGLCKRKRSPRSVIEKPAMDYQLVMKTVRVHLFKQIHRQANRWIGESARALKRGMKSLERCPKRMCPNRNVRIHNGPSKRSESKPLESNVARLPELLGASWKNPPGGCVACYCGPKKK